MVRGLDQPGRRGTAIGIPCDVGVRARGFDMVAKAVESFLRAAQSVRGHPARVY
jgi:hypothetical protein